MNKNHTTSSIKVMLLWSLLTLLLQSGTAHATLIFTQDFDPSSSSANGSSDFGSNNQRADNFTIASSEILGSISWLGIYHGNTTPGSDNFTLRLFADNSGVPETSASLLNFNVGNTVNRTDTNSKLGGSDLFTYQASLTSGINLTSGTTYWLSIVNNVGTSSFDDWGWAASSTGGLAAFRDIDANSWNSGSATFQFELTAVPVPAAVWLLGSALIGLVSFRKKRQA